MKKIKVDKVSKRETRKSGIKSSASGKVAVTAISAVRSFSNLMLCIDSCYLWGYVQEFVDSDLDNTDPGPSTSKPPASTSSKKSKQTVIDSDGDEDDTVGTSQPTKPQPPQKRQIPEAKNASGDVGTRQFAVFVSFLTISSRNSQKSESEISVLLDDEPPKRQHKSKGVKTETVRVASQSSRPRANSNYSTSVQKPKGARQKKEKKDLSKDEETIKRLKVCYSRISSHGTGIAHIRFSLWSSPAVYARSGQRNSKTSITLPRKSNASSRS